MPLETIDPPMAAYEVVRSTIVDLAAEAGFSTPALRRADPAVLAISTPHRIAILGLNRVRGATSLRSVAEMRGWRFLVHHKTAVVAAVDVQGDKNEYRLGHLNEGPFVAGTEQAIRRAESLDAIKSGRFAPIFLLVPAVYVASLWLEDQKGDADLVMTLPPAPKEFTPFGPMPVRAFLAGVERLASQVPAEGKGAKDRSGG
jgi:hypothetical protein